MIRVVVVGGGAVAEGLTREIAAADGDVRLAQQWTRRTHRINELAGADLYILAVSDGAIPEVSGLPFAPEAVVAHTAGCVDIDSLDEAITHRAVIYPLQTFTQGRHIGDFRAIPFFIEGDTPHALATVRTVASAISDNVAEMSSPRRAHLHLAAAFANNFSNAMLSLAEEIATDAGASFDDLRPLVAETFAKALTMPSPRDAQTGAAKRGDIAVLSRHIAMLADSHPDLITIYKNISDQICRLTSKNN